MPTRLTILPAIAIDSDATGPNNPPEGCFVPYLGPDGSFRVRTHNGVDLTVPLGEGGVVLPLPLANGKLLSSLNGQAIWTDPPTIPGPELPAGGTAGQILGRVGSGLQWIDPPTGSGGGAAGLPSLCIIEEQQPLGTNAGTGTGTQWFKRNLNTIAFSGISGVSVANSQITLPAGTYDVRATVPGVYVHRFASRLHNITTGLTLLWGTCEKSDNETASDNAIRSHVAGRIVLAGPTVLELQMRVTYHNTLSGGDGTTGGWGLGWANSLCDVERYSRLELRA